ncbi:hypothetical protein A1O7_05309 [Cladophialophora yegresii CBS 114405]|uniref:RecA family profile 1 domain-containing protein n=1 Tax=Cladophialophora yegresii CBS 114405 TaxID=1182544 RepID=W9W065_9EURO|nr:uncharacterized protein A1O7_05309 [Cladophialophora yegresii CBS 114405]EXJ57886.1 hypothetical protein A1O7_05309 [Cladophialophora yegresii CBS 114405]
MEDRDADVHNFSPPSSQHRLPTVTGIEALQNTTANSRGIPSGLPALDAILVNNGINKLSSATPGIQRGYVTEVFGPPGVGKTTFGLQASVNAVRSTEEASHVLWVNTGSPLIETRLDDLMKGPPTPPTAKSPSSPRERVGIDALLDEKFTYLDAHTLPRLLTVFLYPPASFPSPQTCLIVVDDLSNLLLGAFSRTQKNLKPSAPAAVRERFEKQAASKRFQVMENLATAMSKMAAIRNIAIVVLTNATTNLKSSNRATLKPALFSQAWESAVYTRIMLYRDFVDDAQLAEARDARSLGLRYAEVQRMAKKDFITNPVPFVISSGGLRELALSEAASQARLLPQSNGVAEADTGRLGHDLPLLPAELSQPSQLHLPTQPKKRKAFEIADSEDEDEEDAMVSDPGEPKLPSMALVSRVREDEMLLETHEMALLKRERYARIRGSEDEIPLPSSDAEASIAGSP